MENTNKTNYRSLSSYINKPLATLASVLLLASGCATPQSIQNRRVLGRAGLLDAEPFTEISANNGNYQVRTGVRVPFKNVRDIPSSVATGLGAYLYGVAKPAFEEFWTIGNEYNGTDIFRREAYIEGRKAETGGELSRIALFFGGIAAILMGHHGGGSDNSGNQQYQAPANQSRTSYQAQPVQPTQPANPANNTPVTPVTPIPVTGGIKGDEKGGADAR